MVNMFSMLLNRFDNISMRYSEFFQARYKVICSNIFWKIFSVTHRIFCVSLLEYSEFYGAARALQEFEATCFIDMSES